MSQFKPTPDDNDVAAQYGREVLFEVVFIGNSVKVTAVDAETGVEASIVGAPNMTQYSLKMNAIRKLISVMNRMENDSSGHDPLDPVPRGPRRRGHYA